MGLSPLLSSAGGSLPLSQQPAPGLALRASLPPASCFSLSSSVSFPSSDSDSEGDNPEKKKLQEQLMGKRPMAPWQWEAAVARARCRVGPDSSVGLQVEGSACLLQVLL